VATPPVSVDVPNVVAPLVNVTVPVTPVGSVAVKVTDWPGVEGFTEETRDTTGVVLATTWVSVAAAELLLASPLYLAVTGSLPPGSEDVVAVATPPVSVDVPNVIAPLVNVTVPVTLLGSVAVNVTDWPGVEGFTEETRATTGVVLATTWVSVAAAELLLASPLYVAVTGSLPAGSEDVVVAATPAVSVDVPNVEAPLVNVTVPVTPVGSVAVKVTDWPGVEGFVEEIRVTTGVVLATTWVSVPVAELLLASPLYVAVMGSLPKGSEDVVTVAAPPVSVDVPNVVAPLVNVTVPVTPLGSVAVNVTDWPGVEGFVEEIRVTAGVVLATTWVSVPVAELLLASPLYVAVTGSLPKGSEDVVTVAPPPVSVDVPNVVAPLVNVTVPVTPLGSVAVKVTDWPGVEGFTEEARVTTGVVLVTVWVVDPVAGLLFESPP
jgi:hypothetical protein